eukprot:TRINITY_DN60227_c0_g1_i1.p1 TRINITY_DN60227_c0_g1~~TRINITY_DN60227_c0_g1_i1.p1  ORF type:complete len:1569 (-),score=246.72 TRINITY_DN60227_c0_g1_i1:180-4469(-)
MADGVVTALVIVITLTAPLLGIVGGGIAIDYAGGYRSSASRRHALLILSALALLCILAGCVACFVYNFWIAALGFWFFDLLGAALIPGSTGVMLDAVSSDLRTYASAGSQILINLVGMAGGALVPGLLAGCKGSASEACDFTLALRSLLLGPVVGMLAMILGLSRVRKSSDAPVHMQELACVAAEQSRQTPASGSCSASGSCIKVIGVIDQVKKQSGVMMLDTERDTNFQVVLAKAANCHGRPTRRLFQQNGDEICDTATLISLAHGSSPTHLSCQDSSTGRKVRLDVEVVSTDGTEFQWKWGSNHECYRFGDLILRPMYRQLMGHRLARKVKHPPQPFALPTSGNLKDCLPDLWLRCFPLCEKYGPLIKLRIFNDIVYVCADPTVVDIINQVPDKRLPTEVFGTKTIACQGVFIADGQRWEFARHALMKSLTTEAIDALTPVFGNKAIALHKEIARQVGLDGAIDILEWVEKITMDVICDVGFGHDMRSMERPVGHKDPLVQVFDEVMEASVNASLYGAFDAFGSQKRWFANKNADLNGRLDAIIEAVRYGTQTGQKDSLLNKLMEAQCPLTGRSFDQSELRDQLLTMLVAGHKTSTLLLTWALYHIASDAKVEQRLVAELQTVYGNDMHRIPSGDDLRRCKYLDMIVKETLRLASPVQVAQRGLSQPVQCGEYTLVPGGHNGQGNSWVFIHIMGISRSEKYWGTNRLDFVPERFEAKSMAQWHPFQFIPFGGGKRLCIGNLFAITQIKTLISMMVRRFHLRTVHNRPVKLDPKDLATPLSANAGGGVWLQVVERANWDQAGPSFSPGLSFGNLSAAAIDLARLGAVHSEAPYGKDLLILWGGEFGTTKKAAEGIVEVADQAGFATSLKECDQVAAEDLDKVRLVLILLATYNGHPPSNAVKFTKDLETLSEKSHASFDGLNFAVLATGNSNWVSTFAKVGKSVDMALQRCGASRVVPLECADKNDDFDAQILIWQRALFERLGCTSLSDDALAKRGETEAPASYITVHGDPSSAAPQDMAGAAAGNMKTVMQHLGYSTCPVHTNAELCSQQPERDKYRSVHNIEIALPPGSQYTCGDHLEVWPQNSEKVVLGTCQRLGLHPFACVRVLSSRSEKQRDPRGACGLNQDLLVQDLLCCYVDLQSVPGQEALAAMAEVASDPKDRHLIQDMLGASGLPVYKQWIQTRPSFLDALKLWPSVRLTLARLLEIAPALSPRLYSIASSALVSDRKVRLLCGVVQYETDDGVLHHGLCSAMLARASSVFCKVRAAPHMRLPVDPMVPIVCICGGTGLAPFLGFLEERAEQRKRGVMTGTVDVYFGCRGDYDCLYRSQMLRWEEEGLCSFKVSYSRKEGVPKEYVHSAMYRDADALRSVLSEGGVGRLYLCGAAASLAKDCTNVLAEILGSGNVSQGMKLLNDLQACDRVVFDVWG